MLSCFLTDRLACVELRVGDSAILGDNSLCGAFDNRIAGETFGPRMREFVCDPPLRGRYLSVVKTCDSDPTGDPGYRALHFCEVEAMGSICKLID